MLNNPLIFGILSALIITILYTLIISKLNNNNNEDKSKNNLNNSIILFTISLIVVSTIHLFITSNNIEEIEKLSEMTLKNNISNNMMTGQPNF